MKKLQELREQVEQRVEMLGREQAKKHAPRILEIFEEAEMAGYSVSLGYDISEGTLRAEGRYLYDLEFEGYKDNIFVNHKGYFQAYFAQLQEELRKVIVGAEIISDTERYDDCKLWKVLWRFDDIIYSAEDERVSGSS